MKKILIIAILGLASCSKEYTCTVTTETETYTLKNDVKFNGTKKEMKQFEEDGTLTFNYFGEVKQTTKCKKF